MCTLGKSLFMRTMRSLEGRRRRYSFNWICFLFSYLLRSPSSRHHQVSCLLLKQDSNNSLIIVLPTIFSSPLSLNSNYYYTSAVCPSDSPGKLNAASRRAVTWNNKRKLPSCHLQGIFYGYPNYHRAQHHSPVRPSYSQNGSLPLLHFETVK